MYAALTGKVTCLGTLLDFGADPNVSNADDKIRIITVDGKLFHVGDSKGSTAITYAVENTNAGCVSKLIEAGADVNNAYQDNGEREGNTPLMAAEWGITDVQSIKELIKAGADLNIPDKNGMTFLMKTSRVGNECRPFLELMKAGAEVNTAFLADIARKLLMEEKA